MAKFDIKIEDNVEIPKREMNFGPRGSQYPIADMSQGQSFALVITGKSGQKKQDGTELTVQEDAERKARQKQSYFSSLGKRLGINVVTRYSPESGELRVWHNGPRAVEEPTAEEVEAEAGEAADTGDIDLNDE